MVYRGFIWQQIYPTFQIFSRSKMPNQTFTNPEVKEDSHKWDFGGGTPSGRCWALKKVALIVCPLETNGRILKCPVFWSIYIVRTAIFFSRSHKVMALQYAPRENLICSQIYFIITIIIIIAYYNCVIKNLYLRYRNPGY